MINLIHVLGSDIPHHNQTVLSFFNDVLAETNPDARQFMVVSAEPSSSLSFPSLNIMHFTSRKAVARAVVKLACSNRQQRFLFHGQFNNYLWLALLCGRLKSEQMNWHIWGADLYETPRNLSARLFYLLRRLAQGRVGRVFATRGDLNYFYRQHPRVPGELLYFPTRMYPAAEFLTSHCNHGERLTLIVGNSGDRSNQHCLALHDIHKQFGDRVRVVVPMGYPSNNESYIAEVCRVGRALFSPENLLILSEKINFTDYLRLLVKCDLGYFIFDRQQGIGTLCLLIQMGIPCVLSRANPFWRDMVEQNIPVRFRDDPLDENIVRDLKHQMGLLDKQAIAFFNPNYVNAWRKGLDLAAGVIQ
jgi:dTDP-N-acetylfucosamine:lipid II N-acetylfucosaminyltransferase